MQHNDHDLEFFPFGAPRQASALPAVSDPIMERYDQLCARDAELRARGRNPPKLRRGRV